MGKYDCMHICYSSLYVLKYFVIYHLSIQLHLLLYPSLINKLLIFCDWYFNFACKQNLLHLVIFLYDLHIIY